MSQKTPRVHSPWPLSPLSLISLALLLSMLVGCSSERATLRIGSKPFSENMILAEMIAQLAEHQGIEVQRNIPFGVTQQAMEATKQDVIDLYPEYNGTSLTFLGQAPTSDGEASTATVQKLFEPHGLQMTGKFGFSNDYAIVMVAEHAEELGVKTIADLATVTTPLTFAVDEDFLQRPADGLPQLLRRYGIANTTTQTFPVGTDGKDKIVSSLLDGAADVAELFSTDGQIAEYGLVVLEDNLNFFPVYEAAPLVRSQALADIPKLDDVLQKLSGIISDGDMRAMNRAVDLEAQTPASVANAYLVAKGLLPKGTEAVEVDQLFIATYPGVKRSSETAKVMRAIRAGFSGSDLQLRNTPDPLGAITDGSARIALVGAEAFYRISKDQAGQYIPVAKHSAQAFAVIGHKTGHLIVRRGSGSTSITAMKRIITGPQGTGSAIVVEMLLASLGLSDSVAIAYGDSDVRQQSAALLSGDVDGMFVLANTGERALKAIFAGAALDVIAIDEWAQGGHTAKYSFIRPTTIAANTYPQQTQPIASISTQYVLASPIAKEQETGEVGPGTAGVVAAAPLTAEAVHAIGEELDSAEVLDPAIPVHAALIPKIETTDKALPFSIDISLANILVILFIIWVVYLCSLPSPRDAILPKDLIQ